MRREPVFGPTKEHGFPTRGTLFSIVLIPILFEERAGVDAHPPAGCRLHPVDRNAFLIPVLAVAVATGVVASERLTAPPPPGRKVHVQYWEGWTGFEFDAMKRVVDAFNASQSRIAVDILSVSDIEDKTLMAVAGGVPPDLTGLSSTVVAQYADANAVMRLDGLARANGIDRSQYIPCFWDSGLVRGHLYSLPSTPATVALHYDRELFRGAGLDPDRPPETTEELDRMAERLTKRGRDGRLLVSGFLPTEPGWWNWAWGPMFGGRLWDGAGRITINEPASVRGFAWAQGFAKRYGAGAISTQKGGFGNFDSPQNGFMSKQVGMEFQGVWMYNFIHTYAPTLDWSVAPFPHPADRPDLAEPTIADEDVLCIPAGARHPDAAFEFLRFVESQRGMEMLCLGQKKISPLRKVSPGFFSHHPNPYVRLFTRLAYGKNVFAPPKLGIWKEYDDEINASFDSIMLLQKTPQRAMDDLTARMQPKLDQYLRRLRQRGEL